MMRLPSTDRAFSRRTGGGQRGVALLLVLIMIVLMTAFVSEFNFTSRTKIISSMHMRDDAKAEYLAKSGIRIYGVLLIFGQQIAGNQMVAGMLSGLGINLDGASMICKNIPFLDTAMLRFLKGMAGPNIGDEEEEGLMALMGFGGDSESAPIRGEVDYEGEDEFTVRRGWLDFDGDFKVDCTDESARIDVNGFSKATWAQLPIEQHPIGLMLNGLFRAEQYDPLFEERLKMDRWELIGNIKDFIDSDDQRSGFFGGDEGSLYDDFEPRYRPRNKQLDTLDELNFVAGVTDEVYQTFNNALSVHPKSYKINVNAAPTHVLAAVMRAFADPMVANQTIQTKAMAMSLIRVWSPFRNADAFLQMMEGPTPDIFAGMLPLDPVPIQPEMRNTLKTLLGTDSRVFKLTSTGYLGDSERVIEATIRVDKRRAKMVFLDWKEH